MADEVLIVFSSFASAQQAQIVAKALVEENLAACVSLLPGAQSFYRWEGAVQSNTETIGIIKTTSRAYPALETRIRALHSYQVPEIVCVAVSEGLPAYLDWVRASCGA
jgi:periplasmic divalent cation tolerance protein